jgi:hypothetical protein
VSDYLEEAAEQLRKARDANELRSRLVPSLKAGKETGPIIAEVNARRMEIADGFIRLAAIERSWVPEEQILPHELELRIADALTTARSYGMTGGARHKMWVIDQVARSLTGCPLDQGEEPSEEYRQFVREAGDWDEGIAP